MEDRVLLQRLKAGDETAFNSLVTRYRPKVINTCYRFLLEQENAEDISQEVFIEVFQSITSFKGNSKLSTWIYRIAVTKCLDELKRRKRKKRITSIGKLLHVDSLANWLAGGERPDSAMVSNENMKEVLQALNSLPDNQRVAFTLSKIEGFSNQEIRDIMNTTPLAVESLIARAKKKVSSELKRILENNR